jgi:two-component system KDP operon response regulator KdpE
MQLADMLSNLISKPFGMAELTARIRAALRHRFQSQGEQPLFVSGDLTVDLVRRGTVKPSGREQARRPQCSVAPDGGTANR